MEVVTSKLPRMSGGFSMKLSLSERAALDAGISVGEDTKVVLSTGSRWKEIFEKVSDHGASISR